MNIVTGYRGEPHITANAMQAFNQGILGSGNYVLDVGNKFAATLTNATTVTVQDGEGVMQGVHFRIAPGDTETVSISPGTSGYKRIDLICARYTKSAITGVESVDLVVVEGTPDASTASEPSVNSGTILTGGSPVDFPLWKVSLDGLTPTISQKYTLDTSRVSEVYNLPFDVPTNSLISYNYTKLYIKPATKTLYFNVCFRLAAANANTEITIGQNMPLAHGVRAFTVNGLLFPLVVVNAASEGFPSFGTVRGTAICEFTHTSRSVTYDGQSYAKVYLGTAPGADVFILGSIAAPYRRLNVNHPFSEATIVNDDF